MGGGREKRRTDVLAKEGLNALGDVLPAEDKAVVPVNGAFGTQLRHHELKDVFERAVHALAVVL